MKKKSIYLIFLAVFVIIILLQNRIWAKNLVVNNEDSAINNQEQIDIFKNISAPNLLLAETNTGRILYERNADRKIYPASLTKLMTAILVVENCELDEIVTVSENAVLSVPVGYVNANLQVGEELTVEDLLYVMLIPSANDAANALAEHVGGNIESFSAMMNSKAKELGCTGSNFTNPSGLHQEEQYTTTRDLFLISQEAIENELIEKIIGTTIYTLPSTNKYTKEPRIFATTNYMMKKSLKKYYYDYCIGAKTGYTGEAKNCVVEFAKKDGIELTAIVMGEQAKVKGQKFLDAKEMFEYVFKNYDNKQVAKKNDKYDIVKVSNGTKDTKELEILYKENVNILMKNDGNKEIKESMEYTNLKAPIQKGDIVGKITYNYEGIIYETELIANSNVEESRVLANLLKILMLLLIIFIIYNLKKSKKKYGNHGKNIKKKKKRKK